MRLSNTFGRDRALLDQLDEIICGHVHLYFIEVQWYWGGYRAMNLITFITVL